MTPYDKYISAPGSLNRTIQDWSGKNYSADRWSNGVAEIVGLEVAPVFSTVAEARMHFLYSLEYLFSGDTAEPVDIWNAITVRIEKNKIDSPWSYRDEVSSESNLSAPKVVKVKKQTNQECARDWWIANLERLSGMTPKDIQDELSATCDIHRNSCRGIYYKMKKEYGGPA